jgi:hypothetical protein
MKDETTTYGLKGYGIWKKNKYNTLYCASLVITNRFGFSAQIVEGLLFRGFRIFRIMHRR